jgi:hypothetical protein
VLANINKLNRSLEAVIAVSHARTDMAGLVGLGCGGGGG